MRDRAIATYAPQVSQRARRWPRVSAPALAAIVAMTLVGCTNGAAAPSDSSAPVNTAAGVADPLQATARPAADPPVAGEPAAGAPALGQPTADTSPLPGAPGAAVPSATMPSIPAAPGPAATAAAASGAATVPDPALVTQLLAERDAAVRQRDKQRQLATLARVTQQDRQRVAALVDLPLRTWQSRLVQVRPPAAGDPAGTAVAEVDVWWSLAGADRSDAVLREAVGLTEVAGQWRIADQRAADGRPALWDLGGQVRTARAGGILVLSLGGPGEQAADPAPVAALAASARTQVDRVWGAADANADVDADAAGGTASASGTTGSVIVIPPTDTALGRLLDRGPASLARVPAVAAGDHRSPAAAVPPDRIWLNPDTWRDLSDPARAIVLRHELSHLAQGPDRARAVPLWLSEGLAEYTGYLGSGVPDEIVAADALDRVRATGPPERLPDDADFDPTAAQFDTAYQWAWLAARRLVRLAGEAGAVAVFRRVAGGEPVDQALRAVTGRGEADLLAGVRRDTRTLAGRP